MARGFDRGCSCFALALSHRAPPRGTITLSPCAGFKQRLSYRTINPKGRQALQTFIARDRPSGTSVMVIDDHVRCACHQTSTAARTCWRELKQQHARRARQLGHHHSSNKLCPCRHRCMQACKPCCCTSWCGVLLVLCATRCISPSCLVLARLNSHSPHISTTSGTGQSQLGQICCLIEY